MLTTVLRLFSTAMLVVFLASCGGGGAEMKSNIQTTTQGQQLLDLKKAFEAGAISKEEYERMREKIVKGE